MKSNLAQELPEPQGEVVLFPKKERQSMSKKEGGYTRLSNSLTDDEIMAQLKDKSFKCLVFIIRQTVGFDRASHTIAITQFQKYCGIKKRDTVMSCISELESANLIKVERKTGCLNEYFLTLDQYQQTGLVPNKGSTYKRDWTSTTNGDGTSTVERGTIKENLKENFKESSDKGKPKFFVQENVLAGYVTYFQNDTQYQTLQQLESTYDVNTDFVAQAKASHPSLDLNIDHLSQMFTDMRQWSLTANAGKKQPQQWMNTWLGWVKNNAYKFTAKSKATKQAPASRNVNDQWGEVQQYAPASDIDTGDLL